jgi:hypothetical protein
MSVYSTYYYESAFSDDKSFVLQIIQQIASLLGKTSALGSSLTGLADVTFNSTAFYF